MKIRRFDRRTFVRKTLAQGAVAGHARVDLRVVPLDKLPANAAGRANVTDGQMQAQASHAPQDR